MHWEKSEPLFHLLQPSMNCDGKNEGTWEVHFIFSVYKVCNLNT